MTSALMGVPLGIDLYLRRPLIPFEWPCFSHAFLYRLDPTRSVGWGGVGGGGGLLWLPPQLPLSNETLLVCSSNPPRAVACAGVQCALQVWACATPV